MALLSSSGGTHAPTSQGIQDALKEHCSFEGHRPATSAQRASIRDMYDALARHESVLDQQALEPYFVPIENNPDPKNGRYSTYDYNRFFDEVARPQLRNLPGVTEKADGWAFVGLSPDEVDLGDSRLRAVDDLREHPRTEAENAIDRVAGPGSDKHNNLLALWDTIGEAGEITAGELREKQALRRIDIEHLADDLADIPHIERRVEEPPEPEDIEISTYADVLEARGAVDAETKTIWEYVE